MKLSFWIGALAAAPAVVAPAHAQLTARGSFDPLNYSGLRAQSLSVVNAPTGIGGLIKVASPTVVRTSCRMTAKVLEDRPGALVVEVSYTGLPTNVRKLNVLVADAAGTRAVAGIASASASVSVGEPEATLTFTLPLDPSAAEGALESKRLFVYGLGSQPHIVAVNQMFECNKKWFKQPSILVAEPMTLLVQPPPPPPPPGAGLIYLAPMTMKMATMIAAPPPKPFQGLPTATVNKNLFFTKAQLMRGGKQLATRDVPAKVNFATPRQLNGSLGNMKMVNVAAIKETRLRPELVAKYKIVNLAALAQPSEDVKKNNGLGASSLNPIEFARQINLDGLLPSISPPMLEVEKILSISPTIYADKNPQSGVYYYLPARYNLIFDATNSGFQLQMFYASGADGAPGEVFVTATLRASVEQEDLKVTEAGLRTFLKAQNLPFTQLKPITEGGVGEPKAALEGAIAAQLFINPDKVKVTDSGVDVSIVNIAMSPTVAELFLNRLTSNIGIGGQMIFTSSADAALKVGIPFDFKLPDRNSLKLNLLSDGNFKNTSPFPVAVKYLHVLSFATGLPVVYTFNLPDNEIATGSSVTIDRGKIPAWVMAPPTKIWADFQVIPDSASMEKVLQSATGASSGAQTAQVTVEKVGDFPAGVTAVSVVVTSRYFTPFGSREETKEATLAAADASKTLGPIYPMGRQEGVDLGADKPYIKWSLKVVKNGQTLRTAPQSFNRLTISVGAEQIGAAR